MPSGDLEFEEEARREHEARLDALRKQIADQAARPPAPSGIATSLAQLLLFPLIIAAIAAGMFGLFWWATHQESKSARDWLQQVRATQGYEREWALVNLTAALRSDEEARRDPATSAALIEFYESLPPGSDPDILMLKTYVLQSLGILRDASTIPAVLDWLEVEEDAELRAYCIDALGAIGDPAVASAVRIHLDSESAVIRKYAIFALASFAQAEDQPRLAALLEDPVEDVRWNAALWLAIYYQDPAGLALVRRLLDRDYVWERTPAVEENSGERDRLAAHTLAIACRAVGALRDTDSTETLRHLARNDPNEQVRHTAQTVLRELEDSEGKE